MNDLRFLSLILSGGFLFLGGLLMGPGLGAFLCFVGGCILLIPAVTYLIQFIRWLVTPDHSSHEEPK